MRTGKCFVRSLDLEHGRRRSVMTARSRQPIGFPAGDPVPGALSPRAADRPLGTAPVGDARQCGAKMQPCDRLPSATARCPGSRPAGRAPLPASERIRARGTEPSRARACRDGAAARTARSTGASSTLRPAYITTTRCAISATTPRSWVIRMTAVPVSRLSWRDQVEDLRLDRDVERGGRLVGDQQLRIAGERHGDHHALAHAARELVRILRRRAARASGCRPARSISIARAARPRARRPLVQHAAPRRSGRPTVSTGLSDVIGSWKIIEISVAADRRASRARSARAGRCPRSVMLPPTMRPGGDAIEPHDRERR